MVVVQQQGSLEFRQLAFQVEEVLTAARSANLHKPERARRLQENP